MKLKLAIALIASIAMSCDTSFGCDLLNKMMGRAGCSSCAAPKAPSCGCGGGGLMDKVIGGSAGGCCGSDMLSYDANMSCGPVASSCGCEAAAPVADCGCEAPAPVADCGCGAPAPVADCGCSAPAKKSCSFGLFDRLKGGCGSAAPVADCGCSAPAPVADCGCSAPAPVADCGCSAPAPVADCGCSAPAKKSCSFGLFDRLKGGCGSAAPALSPCASGDCGSFVPAPAPVADCGCSAAPAPVADCGCSAPAPVADCGCSAPAPVFVPAPVADCGCGSPAPVADCGCGAPAKKSCSFGLFDRLKSGGCKSAAPAPVADCGCGSAPVSDCGAPVVSDCGCGAPAAPVSDCGCGAPAPVSDCGCGSSASVSTCGSTGLGFSAGSVAPCGCNGGGCNGGGCNGGGGGGSTAYGKLTLLDRLRGNRLPRTSEGVVVGTGCNDGCNPPCPNQPAADCGCNSAPVIEAAPCTSCGGGSGEIYYGDVQPQSGCTSCGGSEGTIIYGAPESSPMTTMQTSEEATNVDPPAAPVDVVPSSEGMSTEGVIESGDDASEASPVVDPGAFIPRSKASIGS